MIQLRSFGITSACSVPLRELHMKIWSKGNSSYIPKQKVNYGQHCLKRKAFPLPFHVLPQSTKVNIMLCVALLQACQKESLDTSVLGEQMHHLN